MVSRPRHGLSLCAGGGGLDLGLMLAEPGYHTRALIEWEDWPRTVLITAQRAGYFSPAPIWDDLRSFDARPFRGAFDTVLAGYTHADAEVIAATVAGLPGSLGGIRMAISVAELARAGITPNWMPGAIPRCVPVEIKRNRHGDRAVSVVVGTARALISGKRRVVEVRACPVTFTPTPQQIESARQAYDDWWLAMDWVRDLLIAGGMLREVEVTAAMPKVRPWEQR